MNITTESVFKNLDVALFSLPVIAPAAVISGFTALEDSRKFECCESVISAFAWPFRIISVATGTPLMIYTLAKYAFANLLNFVTGKSLDCVQKFVDFESNQIGRNFRFLMFTMAGGITYGAIEEIIGFEDEQPFS